MYAPPYADDYLGLQERLKSKAYNKMYDDLEE